MTRLVVGFLLVLASTAACGQTKPETKAEDTKGKVGDARPETKPDAAAPGTSGNEIGVPECDQFIEKFAKCIAEKVPEAGRAGAQTAMEAMVKGFKDAAAGPAKDQLAATCQASADATKQSMSAMGCSW